MKQTVCFFTVTCVRDYEHLLGGIEHHAEMGLHLVLDTTPVEKAVKFTKLPDSVIWIHEPVFGEGWANFRLRSAVERAMRKARALPVDVLVYLDSDEFFTKDSADLLFQWGVTAMVETLTLHWRKDGNPWAYEESEWHRRVWPRLADVKIAENMAWQAHPKYNGNPEHHPVPVPPSGLQVLRVYGNFHHHFHYSVGLKAGDEESAVATIAGWPDRGVIAPQVPWPERLALWRDTGVLPSESFR
jgi:hypothetical protein